VNTAFIINPKGKVILKYRKVDTQYGCAPHDIHDKYINPITGTRDYFPVVETEIGRLGCMTCADVGIPELPRMYGFKGADVVIHCNGGHVNEIDYWKLRIRAADNTLFLVSAQQAGKILDGVMVGDVVVPTAIDTPKGGQCMIVDYNGNMVAQSADATPQVVSGLLDIPTLRANKVVWRRPSAPQIKGNYVARCRTEMFAPFYNKTVFPPNEVLKVGPMKYQHDESVTRRRNQSVQNLLAGYDFYSENDVK